MTCKVGIAFNLFLISPITDPDQNAGVLAGSTEQEITKIPRVTSRKTINYELSIMSYEWLSIQCLLFPFNSFITKH